MRHPLQHVCPTPGAVCGDRRSQPSSYCLSKPPEQSVGRGHAGGHSESDHARGSLHPTRHPQARGARPTSSEGSHRIPYQDEALPLYALKIKAMKWLRFLSSFYGTKHTSIFLCETWWQLRRRPAPCGGRDTGGVPAWAECAPGPPPSPSCWTRQARRGTDA